MNKATPILLGAALFLFMGQSCATPDPEPLPVPEVPEQIIISSFEECIAAGNPAMESYPRQCRAGDKTFTEEISVETLPLVDPAIPEPAVVEKPIIEPTIPAIPSATETQPLPTSEDSPAADLDTLNFGPNDVDEGTTEEEFDYSEYDSEGRHISDPDYDPTSPFDIDAYNNEDYENTDTVDVYDSPEADIDSVNFGDTTDEVYYDDTSYEDSTSDPNAC